MDSLGVVSETAEVAVVGGGLAGLSAARALDALGVEDVVVLEAQDRVGGRVLDVPLGDEVVALGAQWLVPEQREIWALAAELGVEAVPSRVEGRNLWLHRGRRRSFGQWPRLGPRGTLALARTLRRLTRLTGDGSPETLRRLDEQSFGSWLMTACRHEEARALIVAGAQGQYGAHPGELSLLSAARAARDGGLSSEAEGFHLAGGPQQVAVAMADALGSRVRLQSPVAAVDHDAGGVTVTTVDGRRLAARAAIIALPAPLAGRLRYAPALGAARDAHTQRAPMGLFVKAHARYSRPFWRDGGLSGWGLASDLVSPVADGSPADGPPYVLVAFVAGSRTLELPGDAVQRRTTILRGLAEYFGPAALRPESYVDRSWGDDEWSRGAYGVFEPPGSIAAYAEAARAPIGPIHWATADLGVAWPGYMDGAVESGRRAAEAVALLLQPVR